jgi:peptide/nickel transport system permease protein
MSDANPAAISASPTPSLVLEPDPVAPKSVRKSALQRLLKGLMASPASMLGAFLLVSFLVVAVAAPVLAPCPTDIRLRLCNENPYRVPKYGFAAARPEPPSAQHKFGLTPDQYDIYYGVIWGTRTAFKVGVIIVGLAVLFGIAVGAAAGYYGGWIDEVLMRIVEVFMAFPFLLAAIALASVLRANAHIGQGVIPAMMALVVFGWMPFARLIRSDILSLREREYIWAARSVGAGSLTIIRRHIVPNAIFPVLVLASLEIGTIVISFAALSFLGVGVPDGYADWGQMLSSSRTFLNRELAHYWYLVVFPGAAIVLFSLAWNLIGDTVRDVMDPRLSGKGG